MNNRLQKLQSYPFSKLHSLLSDLQPAAKTPISLSIGEPRHPPPGFVLDEVAAHLSSLSTYPATAGTPELRDSIADWLRRRFALRSIDPAQHILPVNGTREALFAFAQTAVNAGPGALVMIPNPFYQIYEGAALLAGATPRFISCAPDSGQPNFDAVSPQEWSHCQLLYICTPGNPTGAVLPLERMQELVQLAREYDFVIASDECYSEIYPHEETPPPGLLQACAALGDNDYRNCVVFHSLSKRSNLPGLRSGFAAGDAAILESFLRYRTYHGCAMPPHHQAGSTRAWQDEAHVRHNRQAYREKFDAVLHTLDGCLDVGAPEAGFYLWPRTPCSDTDFARTLYSRENVLVLPGRYLARTDTEGVNPGESRVRMALVADLPECVEAAMRIRRCVLESLPHAS